MEVFFVLRAKNAPNTGIYKVVERTEPYIRTEIVRFPEAPHLFRVQAVRYENKKHIAIATTSSNEIGHLLRSPKTPWKKIEHSSLITPAVFLDC